MGLLRYLIAIFNEQIDVSVTAPQSGTILKVLANEEDTVAVGQDLFVLEPGEVKGCTLFSHPSLHRTSALIHKIKSLSTKERRAGPSSARSSQLQSGD